MKKLSILLFSYFSIFNSYSQSTTFLPGSASFDSGNQSKFIKYPSLSTTQISQILNPTSGMVVFDGTTNCLKMYNGTKWVSFLTNDKVDLPTASVNSGTYNECKIVTLNTNSTTNKIYYSLDGSTPTTSSTQYTTPLKVNSTTTLKAIAVNECKINSEIMTNNYNITPINGQIGGIHYVNWNFGIPQLTTFEINFKIYDYPRNSDGTLNGDGLYFQMYNATLNGQVFYFGIQTSTRNPATNATGRGFIFSRFGTQDLSNAQTAVNGFTESANYEGPFISVRKFYDWKPQSYKFKITKTSTDAVGDWYSVYLKDLVTMQEDFMGAIRFPLVALSQQGMNSGSGSWTEIYSKANPNTPLPNWHISLSNAIANQNINFVTGESIYAPTMKNSDIFYDSSNKECHIYMGANICREHNATVFQR